MSGLHAGLDQPLASAPEAAERLPGAVVDAAISWSIKLDHGQADPPTRLAFERWRGADPRHAQAWARVQALAGLTAGLQDMPAGLALHTLQAADARGAAQKRGRRQALKLLGLGGAALVALWATRDGGLGPQRMAEFSTAVGQQRSLRLADGTLLLLNTDSTVRIDLSGPRRRVLLQRGEMLVHTGADTGAPVKRPFWVEMPVGRLQALGTRFVVRLEPGANRARVSVQESAVLLYPAAGGAGVLVQAGDSRWLGPDRADAAPPPAFEADAWAEGAIAGKNIRLATLLAELGRYRPGAIHCDPRVADLRVSGVYQIGHVDQTLQFLARTQALRLVLRADGTVWMGPQPGP